MSQECHVNDSGDRVSPDDKRSIVDSSGLSDLSHDMGKVECAGAKATTSMKESVPGNSTLGVKVLSIDDLVPENFSHERILHIRDMIDRKSGECIGIKQMGSMGYNIFPETIPTHTYIWFVHFFELSKVITDLIKAEIKSPGHASRWIKFVRCIWERDMSQQQSVHEDLPCSNCRKYFEKLSEKSIWWLYIGNDKFIRITFKDFIEIDNFDCCILWIKVAGVLEVQLHVEDESVGRSKRRSFRVISQKRTSKRAKFENVRYKEYFIPTSTSKNVVNPKSKNEKQRQLNDKNYPPTAQIIQKNESNTRTIVSRSQPDAKLPVKQMSTHIERTDAHSKTSNSLSVTVDDDRLGDSFSSNFERKLVLLNVNNKTLIDELTKEALIGYEKATELVNVIVYTAVPEGILKLYVIDAILKSVGGVYVPLFSKHLLNLFWSIFTVADAPTRKKMFMLRTYWCSVLSEETLLSIDVAVNGIDVNWPIQKSSTLSKQAVATSGIPLVKPRCETIVSSQSSVREDDRSRSHGNRMDEDADNSQSCLSQRIAKAVATSGIPLVKPRCETIVSSQSSVREYDRSRSHGNRMDEDADNSQSCLSQRIAKAVATSGIPLVKPRCETIVSSQSSVREDDRSRSHGNRMDEDADNSQSCLSQRIAKAVATSGIPLVKPRCETIVSSQSSVREDDRSRSHGNRMDEDADNSQSCLSQRKTSFSQDEIETEVLQNATNDSQEANVSANSFVSNYSSPNESVGVRDHPKRRARTDKNWIKVCDYDTYAAALADIKEEKTWSTASRNDYSITFRCNKVKSKTEQCQSGVKVVFNDYNVSVSLYVSRNPHNCDQLEKSSNKMTDEARNFIKIQFDKGLKTKAIQDEFISAGLPLPRKYLISNEVNRLKKIANESSAFKVSELNELLRKHKNIPDDELDGYVIDYQIDDHGEELKFNFVVSSKKLLHNNVSSVVCNADTTYKLIWQGFPVHVVGFTDGSKRFHPNSISVSSNEAQDDYLFTFKSLKEGTKAALNDDWKPRIVMCDASKAISNAFREIFGSDIIELMCWFHAKMAMLNQVATLIPDDEQKQVTKDIDLLQLAQSPEMFRKASTLFLEKYAKHKKFVEYFQEQWLVQHPNWYEGACTTEKAPSTNNGLEAFNRTIKDEKTLRRRLPLQLFFKQLLTWIHQWGARYIGGANEILFHPRIDLKLMTKAYQWKKENKTLKYDPRGFIMVPAGKEKDLSKWSQCREDWITFDDFKTKAFMGWSTTVPGDDWMEGTCNCPSFFKDFMCKHVVGIAIRRRLFEVPFEAKQVPIGGKRKRGRPKLARGALNRD